MEKNSYQIKYNNDSLIYEPLTGIIKKNNGKERFRIYKNKNDLFPDYTNIPANSLVKYFKPICLTIYLNHKCNLNCSYCYVTDKEIPASDKTDGPSLCSVAEIVSQNCMERGMPFILGFHGGNEPLLNPTKIDYYIETCREITQKHGIGLIPVCTTNGAITSKIAQWGAKKFYAITLSWDGPPDIQDRLRVFKDGSPTSSVVKRTAKILLDKSNNLKQFKVRATVTNESAHRLLEITKYFHQNNIRRVEFYPLYQNSRNSISDDLFPQAEIFVKNYILAKIWGCQNGMMIGFAGNRINDFHDKFCPVYQHNLTITPDGDLTACFMATHNFQDENYQFMYGKYDNSNQLIIDWEKLKNIFNELAESPSQCEDCFNYLHCAKGCPSICPLNESTNLKKNFDCKILKWIGLANILTAAGHEFTEDELNDCENFFSDIQIKRIKERVT